MEALMFMACLFSIHFYCKGSYWLIKKKMVKDDATKKSPHIFTLNHIFCFKIKYDGLIGKLLLDEKG